MVASLLSRGIRHLRGLERDNSVRGLGRPKRTAGGSRGIGPCGDLRRRLTGRHHSHEDHGGKEDQYIGFTHVHY